MNVSVNVYTLSVFEILNVHVYEWIHTASVCTCALKKPGSWSAVGRRTVGLGREGGRKGREVLY